MTPLALLAFGLSAILLPVALLALVLGVACWRYLLPERLEVDAAEDEHQARVARSRARMLRARAKVRRELARRLRGPRF